MFKKIRLYKAYRKIVKEKEQELLSKFNVRVDKLGRLYTVINVPPQADTFGPTDGPRITKALLQNWLNKLDNYLIEIGVKEFTAVQELKEIDEMNYLLIIKFKLLNVSKIANNTILISALVGGATVISTIVLLLIKLLF